MRKFTAGGFRFELEPLMPHRDGAGPVGLAGNARSEWHIARVVSSGVDGGPAAWQAAYEAASALGVADGSAFVEPDFVQSWPSDRRGDVVEGIGASDACRFDDQDADLPHRSGEFAWHLADGFSQLRRARDIAAHVGTAGGPVRIAHLDTGYDPDHATFPAAQVDLDLQRNFVDRDLPNDARDRRVAGLMKHPGHGAGTLSILAGARVAFSAPGYAPFDDVLGAAPHARIVPVRVGNSVVQLKTSSVAQGIAYAAGLCDDPATRIHVLSMSMGGLASSAWADAVNRAYEAGIVLVTAAGNNISAGFFAFPAESIVYPARFRRVIAACGVMADRRPYTGLAFRTMQGNYGPDSKMATALSAFTPNMPWAQIGCRGIIDMNGAGTSSATPQVAGLAALYMQAHAAALAAYPERWMVVEAVRRALFASADRSADGGKATRLGNGIIRAAMALGLAPADAALLEITRPDSASFPFLRVISGIGVGLHGEARPEDWMLQLEATQLAQRWARLDVPNPVESAVDDPDREAADVPLDEQRRFFEAVEAHEDASPSLRERARQVLLRLAPREVRHAGSAGPSQPTARRGTRTRARGAGQIGPQAPAAEAVQAPAPAARPKHSGFTPPTPSTRCLRGYALDPMLDTTLDTAAISHVAMHVPWEPLKPGPVGEYLEVIDIDPPSQCCYEPVDLDHPAILAQDGLTPGEGTPQFHQQMVYAVCSLTIRNFERALGRRALWSHRRQTDGNRFDDSEFVPRLRVYPHALRQSNAYYSPTKVALMFGYFTAGDVDDHDHLAGGRVFTCLSHDIIAHETTHALLDGMDPEFLVASNPDVLAFHEAFSDLVALFQHFTFPEILAHQIQATRGQLRTQRSLLGELAGQFGRATGLRGGLRYGIGKVVDGKWQPYEPRDSDYETKDTPHSRGSVLVGAVFDAFLAIYERRSADLLRLATGGRGVLAEGAIAHDLVRRLAGEAAKSAHHVLAMCIRALDYCPPTDITFGEYLRAIITADAAMEPDDDLNYRVAFVEAFRKRGIYPRDVRTLGVESLRWRSPEDEACPPSPALIDLFRSLRADAMAQQYARTRRELFDLQRSLRILLHGRLTALLSESVHAESDAAFLGLQRGRSFEVHIARFAQRIGAGGRAHPQLVLSVLQRRQEDLDAKDPGAGRIMFRGGATIVVDLVRNEVVFCIRKNTGNERRLDRQRAFELLRRDSLAAVYSASAAAHDVGEPLALLHMGC